MKWRPPGLAAGPPLTGVLDVSFLVPTATLRERRISLLGMSVSTEDTVGEGDDAATPRILLCSIQAGNDNAELQ